jgi:hypothetical protein
MSINLKNVASNFALIVLGMAIMGIMHPCGAQDFVKGWEPGQPINLSGLDKSVFDNAMFQGDGWFMDPSMALTPSMSAFLADNPEDGRPIGNVTPKHAYVGSAWKGKA